MHFACLFERTPFCAASRRKPLESRAQNLGFLSGGACRETEIDHSAAAIAAEGSMDVPPSVSAAWLAVFRQAFDLSVCALLETTS